MRHFQTWNDKSQPDRISYIPNGSYKVKIYVMNPDEAQQMECDLINKYQPRDNQLKIQYCTPEDIPDTTLEEIEEEDFENIDIPF